MSSTTRTFIAGHHRHFDDEAAKFYPKHNFPKQMFAEFAETWVGQPPTGKSK